MVILEGILQVGVNFTGHSPRKGRVLKFLLSFLERSALNTDTEVETF